MINTVKRGRDLPTQAINSAALSYGIYGSLGQQAALGAEGAAKAAGYFWNRNDTFYPTLMKTDGSGGPSDPNSSLLKPVKEEPISGYLRGDDGLLYPADEKQMR